MRYPSHQMRYPSHQMRYPFPSDAGVSDSFMSTRSGDRGRAAAENSFIVVLSPQIASIDGR